MVKVERIGDLVMFSDEEAGVGFSCEVSEREIMDLQHHDYMPLTKHQCEVLWERLLTFQVTMFEGGKMFMPKRKRDRYLQDIGPITDNREVIDPGVEGTIDEVCAAVGAGRE